jgi:hypothetical protein
VPRRSHRPGPAARPPEPARRARAAGPVPPVGPVPGALAEGARAASPPRPRRRRTPTPVLHALTPAAVYLSVRLVGIAVLAVMAARIGSTLVLEPFLLTTPVETRRNPLRSRRAGPSPLALGHHRSIEVGREDARCRDVHGTTAESSAEPHHELSPAGTTAGGAARPARCAQLGAFFPALERARHLVEHGGAGTGKVRYPASTRRRAASGSTVEGRSRSRAGRCLLVSFTLVSLPL